MNTRLIEDRDVEDVLEIQWASPEIAQWTAQDYARVVAGEMTGWVAEEHATVIGFLVARRVLTDLEILNLAVRPDVRRCGVGATLVREALAWGKELRAEKVLLEVRASNLAALHFYERHGFRATGRRPRYYAGPIEDALLLTGAIE
jgi:[ribosomal protein S18]-alanine N-acetyltransferase